MEKTRPTQDEKGKYSNNAVLVAGHSVAKQPKLAKKTIRIAGLKQMADQIREHMTPEDIAHLGKLLLDPVLCGRPSLRGLGSASRTAIERYGSQETVARRISKTQGYVSQRLALLDLHPQLQHELENGQLTIKIGRSLAKLPHTEQIEHWKTQQDNYYPVINNNHASEQNTTTVLPGNNVAPRRRREASTKHKKEPLPLGSVTAIAATLRKHLTPEQLNELAQLITR